MATTMKTKSCILGVMLAASLPAAATLYEFDSGAITQVIPDNNLLGTGNALTYTLSGAETVITDVWLSFTLVGGYAGDLSGYLRLGTTVSSPYFDLTTFIGTQTLNPSLGTTYTLDFSTPTHGTGFSSAIDGANPNDTWTLFFADSGAGDVTTVTGWSLDIVAVPEPVSWAGLVFGGGLLAFHGLRTQAARRRIGRWRTAVNQWLDAA